MRNIKKILTLILLTVISLSLIGCVTKPIEKYQVEFESNGGTNIESIYVTNGQKIEMPLAPLKEGYIFDNWYLDEELLTIYDFTKPVTNNLKLYAAWKEILEDEIITEIVGVNLPSNISAFNSTKLGSDNDRTEFLDLTNKYIVGDDNIWVVKPNTTFIAHNITQDTYRPIVVKDWEYIINIFVFQNGDYEQASLENYIDSIDTINCTIDFNEAAIGKQFKIAIYPTGLTEEQLEQNSNTGKFTISLEIEVVDGYNAYNALDLAHIDNRNSSTKEGAAWEKFKIEKNIGSIKNINSIIIHSDITITKDDVPGYMFLGNDEVLDSHPDKDTALGSLRDYSSFYQRNLANKEEFKIYGNYFTIDTSLTREVVREDNKLNSTNKPILSHANLMKFNGDGSSNVLIDSLNIIGNAPKVENELKSGGQIIFKAENTNMHYYNLITTRCFISFFNEGKAGVQVIEKCKAYDAFNSFVYNWGGEMEIIQSEMIGAGGPVIIQDHVKPGKIDEMIAVTKIYDSNLQSWVAGTEGWFNITNATALVGGLLSMNQYFNSFGRTFTKVENGVQYFNLILVNKSGNAQSATSELVSGTAIFDNKVFDYGKNNLGLKEMIIKATAANAPVFQSSEADLLNGYGYFNGTNTIDVQGEKIVDVTNPLFSGEQLCIYLQGMAVILGYQQLG